MTVKSDGQAVAGDIPHATPDDGDGDGQAVAGASAGAVRRR
jgi:hypothetical protein